MSMAKSGVENQACTSVATWQANCCEALPPSTTDMYFGGASHGISHAWTATGYVGLERPEVTKNETCSDTQCQDCSDPTSCWHGRSDTAVGDGGREVEGALKVEVPIKEGEITSYTTGIWVKCGVGGGKLLIDVYAETNGVLSLVEDLRPVATFSAKSDNNP